MADIPTTESSEVTIADAAGTNKLAVNADGTVNVLADYNFANANISITYNADHSINVITETGPVKTRTSTFAYTINGCIASITTVVTP